jgi:hypothetical protein
VFSFENELTDLRQSKQGPWQSYIPPQLAFVLGPQESRTTRQTNTDHCITLIIHLDKNYPSSIPCKMQLTNPGPGVPAAEVERLAALLQTEAQTKANPDGQTYLIDLCFTTQEFLHQLKNPQRIRTKSVKSDDPNLPPLEKTRQAKPSYLDTAAGHSLANVALPYVEIELDTEEFKVPFYKSRLLSDDLDPMGFERRLLLHPNGNIFISHIATLLPRALNRLDERKQKLNNFCHLLLERLKTSATKCANLLTPISITVESEVDLSTLDECDYLHDYFDEKRTDQNFQRNSCRIYIIYPFINDKGVLDPGDLDGLRRITRDLLQTVNGTARNSGTNPAP